MKRVKYEIDPYNRLTVEGKNKRGIKKYRLSLDGYFKTDKKNTLQYVIKSPYKYSAGYRLPHRINLKGGYSLTKNHDLLINLSRSFRQRSKEVLLLKGDIVYVKDNALGFAVATRDSSGNITTRTLRLSGRWKIDDNNRLSFFAERGRGKYDTLRFSGQWNVNKDNEIKYTYKKTRMKRKVKREETLTFKGSWKIIDKNRLNYDLGISKDSKFEFKGSLQRMYSSGKRNALLYKIGTGVSGYRLKPKTIKIFGQWKLTAKTGLVFEIAYSGGRKSRLSFGAQVHLSKRDELVLLLKDKYNEPVGIEITLKRRFIKNRGLALLKLLASKKERSIQISVGSLF